MARLEVPMSRKLAELLMGRHADSACPRPALAYRLAHLVVDQAADDIDHGELVQLLIEAGLYPIEAACVVAWGTRPNGYTITGVIEYIAELVEVDDARMSRVRQALKEQGL